MEAWVRMRERTVWPARSSASLSCRSLHERSRGDVTAAVCPSRRWLWHTYPKLRMAEVCPPLTEARRGANVSAGGRATARAVPSVRDRSSSRLKSAASSDPCVSSRTTQSAARWSQKEDRCEEETVSVQRPSGNANPRARSRETQTPKEGRTRNHDRNRVAPAQPHRENTAGRKKSTQSVTHSCHKSPANSTQRLPGRRPSLPRSSGPWPEHPPLHRLLQQRANQCLLHRLACQRHP